MFADALSSSSLGEPASSSQISGTPGTGVGASVGAMQETLSRPGAASSNGDTATGAQDKTDEAQGDRMDVDEPPEGAARATQTGRLVREDDISYQRSFGSSVDPSPNQSEQVPMNVVDRPRAVQPRAPQISGEEQRPRPSPTGVSGSAGRNHDESTEVEPAALLSAIRQGDSDLYNLSFAELQQSTGRRPDVHPCMMWRSSDGCTRCGRRRVWSRFSSRR